jgi:hypothetical protein
MGAAALNLVGTTVVVVVVVVAVVGSLAGNHADEPR